MRPVRWGFTASLLLLFFVIVSVCSAQTNSSSTVAPEPPQPRPAGVESAIALICPQHEVTLDSTGKVDGCKSCPQGTDLYGNGTGPWILQHTIAGHFTSPQDQNLILNGSGCDTPDDVWGGSFVIALRGDQPSLLRYNPGISGSLCSKLSSLDGHDFMICKFRNIRQDWKYDEINFTKFDSTGKGATDYLLQSRDSTEGCQSHPRDIVQESAITGIKFSPQSHGVITGMTVTATYRSFRCSRLTTPPKLKTFQIRFAFNGKRFRVALRSRDAFELYFNPFVEVETS
jgi:hypothetical protein